MNLSGILAQIRADLQVFKDGEVGEHAPPLRHQCDAAFHHLLRIHAGDVLAVVEDRAAFDRNDAGDGAKRGGFAGAVRADQSDDLALVYAEGNALERLDTAVADHQVLHFQQTHSSSTPK